MTFLQIPSNLSFPAKEIDESTTQHDVMLILLLISDIILSMVTAKDMERAHHEIIPHSTFIGMRHELRANIWVTTTYIATFTEEGMSTTMSGTSTLLSKQLLTLLTMLGTSTFYDSNLQGQNNSSL